ncbi:hypothetical protein HFP15_03850 [Amycolatopsis sp. K13G38]|uniref:Uncharacterized protein n=1 Tax=Amycolatopsis acididurans TaxID=2724524 RepID=A0ABX1J0Z2_9PSEU|nr:hypothetical protein [Amycolatopsis acididurans]NKQ52010.1 hypothetical protein [Amycolatopsis acididurans]
MTDPVPRRALAIRGAQREDSTGAVPAPLTAPAAGRGRRHSWPMRATRGCNRQRGRQGHCDARDRRRAHSGTFSEQDASGRPEKKFKLVCKIRRNTAL